jgi:outer membrane protein OmpA-like peptidoglycan-associated protein
MDLRFSQFEILTFSGCIGLCLLLVCVFNEASGIEEDLAARVTGAVQQQGLFWVSVDAQGQKIVLAGAAPDYSAKQRAGQSALAAWGVTEVDNSIITIGSEAGVCQQQIDELLKNQRVSFRAGRAELADQSAHVLRQIASRARGCGVRMEIATHTDSKGDAEINRRLSQRRADAVRKFLVTNGVDAEQLLAVGYGESQALADNASSDGRKANRRVEFRVLGDAA